MIYERAIIRCGKKIAGRRVEHVAINRHGLHPADLFLVSTSFVKESGGPEITRPFAATAESKEKTNMVVSVTSDGQMISRTR